MTSFKQIIDTTFLDELFIRIHETLQASIRTSNFLNKDFSN